MDQIARAELFKVPSGFGQTERAIWATTHNIGVGIALAVVLPIANRTQLKITKLF